MAENEKVEQAVQAKKDKKAEKKSKPGFFARAAKWLKDMKSEQAIELILTKLG